MPARQKTAPARQTQALAVFLRLLEIHPKPAVLSQGSSAEPVV